MPGLVGIVSNNTGDEQLLDKMIYSIKHKPWQRIDKHVESTFRIARVHLEIFNPELQPIFNEDKTLCVFIYGKIYGYEEEMKKLKEKHHFIFNNDPEFCLHSYEEYGKRFVKKLNGSFVLIICDFTKKELIIVNDRYGLRPIYYTMNNSRLLFASEMKAILQDIAFKKELNDEAVADFFAFGEIYGNKTFFKRIEVLPPASIFTYKDQAFSIESYWDFNYEPDYNISEDALAEHLVEAFRKAVTIRMKDDLRYGVELSGGLDSRSVVGAIDKDRRKDIVTFTFGIQGCNEAKIAEAVSKIASTKHIFIKINPDDVITPYSEEVVRLTEGVIPIHVGHQVFAFEKMKPYVDVCFDGLAFDLLLGASFLRKQIFKAKNDEELFNMLNRRRINSDSMMAKLFVNKYYSEIKDVPNQSIKSSISKRCKHPCNKYDYIMLQNHVRRWTFCAGNSMIRNTIEQALPTYDNNLIDTILKIPPELRFRHRIYRKFLIKLAPDLARIPYNKTMIRADAPLILWLAGRKYQNSKVRLKKIIWKISKGRIYLADKHSYAPFGEWLKVNKNWKEFTINILLSNNSYLNGFLKQEFIRTIIEEHQSGKNDHTSRLDYLIAFEFFLRMFMADSISIC